MHTGTHYAHAACMPTPRPACTSYILKYKVGTRPHVQQPSRLRAHPRASSRASPGPPASPWPCGGSGRSAAGEGRRQRGRPTAACVRPCVRACGVCAGGWGGEREGVVSVAASAAIAAAGAGLPSPSPEERAVELELEEEEVVRPKWPPERTEWCDPGRHLGARRSSTSASDPVTPLQPLPRRLRPAQHPQPIRGGRGGPLVTIWADSS